MGVHGLWKILEPTANPVKLDTLRGKVLAIDASIWIYHFLKAMRDPKGTILTAAHIIGFFRRICKLMFFEIKPVFVFDGAAPILKKRTTKKRNERRIGREQNARATANKLLTLQLQRAAATASLNEQHSSAKRKPDNVEVIGSVPTNAKYMDEVNPHTTIQDTTSSNQPQNSHSDTFVKSDQYHLPSIESLGPIRNDDQRLLTQDELDEYSNHFTSQARSGFIDTSLVDFHSSEFQQLPIETQYQLLNMARLKSRLRMGYTADELNKMFPNEMEFSKFQINRVAQRNFFTQRLMNLVGLEDDLTRRVSSEKNKEYYLKRTDQGWALTLEENNGPSRSIQAGDAKPTTHTDHQQSLQQIVDPKEEEEEEEDSDFEEVDLSTPAAMGNNDSLEYHHHVGPHHEEVDLTAEDSAKLDELFGFEAQLSREDLYNKLIDEAVEGEADTPKDRETETRKHGNGARSLLFGNRPLESREHTETGIKKPEKPVKENESMPSVPWFEQTDNNFEEMKINERSIHPNIISAADAEYLSASEVEAEAEQEAEREVESEPIKIPGEDNVHLISGEKKPPATEIDLPEQNKMAEEPLREQPHSPLTEVGKRTIPHIDSENVKLQESKETDTGEPHQQESRDATISSEVSRIAAATAAAAPEEKEQIEGELEEAYKDAEEVQEEAVELDGEAAERAEEEAIEEEEEDEDIAGMLIAEAEENERFARELAQQSKGTWTAEDQRDYETQINDLRKQFNTQSRDADNISNEMIQECQELLQLFGIPYITAPAEAEAQCAELRQLKLVDGVVTDDGDTFLFDTNAVVYRNMFNQAKFVEFYTTKQIEQKLGLSREALIDLAFLLGSDYTEGLLGIGPVTGVEILAEFGNLENFARWWHEAQRFPDSAETSTPLKRRLLKQFASKLFLAEDFPSPFIKEAYLHPTVDKDATRFSWGTPDLDGLRKFMATVAGWSVEKTNGALLPVVQEAKRRELLSKTETAQNQMRLDEFYQTVVQNPELGSKRAAKAAVSMRKRRATSEENQ